MNKHKHKSLTLRVAMDFLVRMDRNREPLSAKEYVGLVNFVTDHGERALEDFGWESVLHTACRLNAVELIDACLIRDAKSKVNKDTYGTFPLHTLVRSYSKNKPTRINEVLAHGADINQGDREGRSPLMVCIRRPLRDDGIQDDLSTLLISLGGFGKARDILGMTELHHAVSENQVPVVRALVDKGMSVNEETNQCLLPIHFARSLTMMSTLMELGAGVHVLDKNGGGLLSAAMNPFVMGDEQCAEVLLKAGCGLSGVRWDCDATVDRFKSLWARVGHQLELPHKTELLVGLLCEGGEMAHWATEQLSHMAVIGAE